MINKTPSGDLPDESSQDNVPAVPASTGEAGIQRRERAPEGLASAAPETAAAGTPSPSREDAERPGQLRRMAVSAMNYTFFLALLFYGESPEMALALTLVLSRAAIELSQHFDDGFGGQGGNPRWA